MKTKTKQQQQNTNTNTIFYKKKKQETTLEPQRWLVNNSVTLVYIVYDHITESIHQSI